MTDTQKFLDTAIWDLDLPARTFFCLQRAGIGTVGNLVAKSEQEILQQIPKLGEKSLEFVKGRLAELGLSFKVE